MQCLQSQVSFTLTQDSIHSPSPIFLVTMYSISGVSKVGGVTLRSGCVDPAAEDM